MIENLLNFQLIDIVSIQSPVSRAEFSAEKIENLAQNFLRSGGNIKPLIVKRISPEEFEVVEGHFEFYAAKRAREVNQFFEMVRAIILDVKNQDGVLEQINLLISDQPVNISDNQHLTDQDANSGLSQKVDNLEQHLSRVIDELRHQIEQQNQLINRLGKTESEFLSYLDYFNKSSIVELSNILDRKAGLSGKEANSIAELIVNTRQHGEFENLLDITERVFKKNKTKTGKNIRAISKDRLLKMIDSWSQADSKG